MTISIPIWVRVSVIIALVLVGVVVSSMSLSGITIGSGGHEGGRDRGSQMEGMQGMGHNGGQTGPAAPSESEQASNLAPCSEQTPPQEGGPSDGPDDPTPTPGLGDHTGSGGSRGH